MADQPEPASVLEVWPTKSVPGLNPWKKSVSNIEPALRVRAIVARTHQLLVGDPTRDLVTALREAAEEVAPGADIAEWSALNMIAGKQRSAIDDSCDRVTSTAVRRLRLSYVSLGRAMLRADQSLRRKVSYQRSINSLAMEILRRARDVDPDDPILAGHANYGSPVLQRMANIAEHLSIVSDVAEAKSRAIELLHPVAHTMGPAVDGEGWTEPLDRWLRNPPDANATLETNIFEQALVIAADENSRLSLILRALPPQPTVRAHLSMYMHTKRSLPSQVKMAPVATPLHA